MTCTEFRNRINARKDCVFHYPVANDEVSAFRLGTMGGLHRVDHVVVVVVVVVVVLSDETDPQRRPPRMVVSLLPTVCSLSSCS